MQAAAMTSRFLTGCSSIAGFADSESVGGNDNLLRDIVAGHLIQTVSSQELFLKLTNALIQFAEQAYLRRDLDALEDVSRVLMNLPVEAARQIGQYYHALVIKRKGHLDEAQRQLETVADNAPLNYRARAIQGLGANYLDKGQPNETLRFQLEALRIAPGKNAHGWQTMLMAHGEIAVVRSLDGDHKSALSDLEGLWPLVCHVARQNPFYFYLFHNELAVELGEAGRIEEAEAACAIAVASPFASAYPEWNETRDEIAARRKSASPSVVAIHRTPEVEPATQRELQRKPKPLRALAFNCPASDKEFLQRSTLTIPARAVIAFNIISILDRVLICIRPRAPPVLS